LADPQRGWGQWSRFRQTFLVLGARVALLG
jgi:hypothetical protein